MEFEFKKTRSDDPAHYLLNFKKSLVVALVFFNILTFLSPDVELKIGENESPAVVIDIENIPMTHQTRVKPPPPRPTVPVPTEDETIPEDITIVETTLKNTNVLDDTPGEPGFVGTKLIPPKPIAWVFPKYPEEEKKKGIQGVVKLSIHINEKGKVVEVVVIDNTTNSDKCAQAAVEAAYGSRFRPAREGNQPINFWITQPYRFDIKN